MNKDDTVYLRHILECIRRITEDTVEGRARFLASHTLQDAVLRNLQVLAESTQRLSATRKATQPGIEWRTIAAFRNILVHDYLGIDLETVWDITQRDVPTLQHTVTAMLCASTADYPPGRSPGGDGDPSEPL